MGMRVSVSNLLTELAPTYVSESNPLYPYANLKSPQRPLKQWRSLTDGAQAFIYDLGSVPVAPYGMLFLAVNTTAPRMILAGNTVYDFSPAVFYSDHMILENPITGRRNLGVWFRSWPYRYVLFYMPPENAPADGAEFYRCGGFWFGPCLDAPPGINAELTMGPLQPATFTDSENLQIEDYQDHGPPRVSVIVSRRAKIGPGIVGVDDELSRWQTLDRAWGGRAAAVMLSERDTTKAWVMRNVGELDYTRGPVRRARNDMVLHEALGP